MFMADLCYIFINIISSDYLNRLRVFEATWSTKTILTEVCILLNKYDEKKYFCIFEKETSKSNMTVSNNSVNIGHCSWAWKYW